MTVEPDEMVPNCVTCRQHFEDYGHALLLWAKADLEENELCAEVRDIRGRVSLHMRAFHEDHLPDDN